MNRPIAFDRARNIVCSALCAAIVCTTIAPPSVRAVPITYDTIALTDMSAPQGNGQLDSFDFPLLNRWGQVAFFSVIKNTTGGTSDNTGVYLHDGATLLRAFRENDPPPDGNGLIDSFSGAPIINDAGQVLQEIKLKNTSLGSTDDYGLYLSDGVTPQTVVRETVWPPTAAVVLPGLLMPPPTAPGTWRLLPTSKQPAMLF